VLTCADLSAVGPDVFNDWKGEVLASLYQRTMRQLTGESTAQDDDRLRGKLTELLMPEAQGEWFERQLEYLPSAYLHGASPVQLAGELRRLSKLDPQQSEAWAVYLPESQTMEYVVATHESIARGIFHKLTGALTSQGLQILSADIHTLADGLVLDRFRVKDPDFAGQPDQDRIERVKKVLLDSLIGDEAPVFRKLWQHRKKSTAANIHRQPTRVRVDNNTSTKFTILDIFATDQIGLLYTIANRLFHSNLSVAGAKIGTYLDQVVDVFYVTDRLGGKIENEQRLRDIRQQLLDAIAQLEAGA
jgi:[protein-PII] uridylyltransferase